MSNRIHIPEIIPMQVGTSAISVFRALIVDSGLLELFNPSDPTHYGRCIGVSKTAGLPGELIEVVTFGEYISGVILTPQERYFVQANGVISTIVPNSGLFQEVGLSKDASKFQVNIKQTIIL